MIFCWGHSFYRSEWKTKFHKVETGQPTFAESVVKHTTNSKLKPRGRDGDSTDGVISVTPPCNEHWIQFTLNKQGKDALPHLLNSAKSTQDVNTYASNSEAECLSYPDFGFSLMDYPTPVKKFVIRFGTGEVHPNNHKVKSAHQC